MATTAPMAVQLEQLAAEILEASKSLSANNDESDWTFRYKVKQAAQKIIGLTQRPDELWFDQSLTMCEFACIRQFMGWKVSQVRD